MLTTRRLTLTLDVHTFVDEDYDDDDRPIAVEVIDSMGPTSIDTELPDFLVRQLGDYLLHTSSGQHILSTEIPQFMTHHRPEKKDN